MKLRQALPLGAAALAALGSVAVGSAAASTTAPAALPTSSGSGVSAAAAPTSHGPARDAAAGRASHGLWRPKHVVVVLEENHGLARILRPGVAPYIRKLATSGASMTSSWAETHPSQPNYLALFSGSTQGVVNDSCPHSFSSSNLGSELLSAGLSFSGYAESMPGAGYTGCTVGKYARKHNPVADFTDLPKRVNQPFTSFPRNYSSLPTVSFVVPDLVHDMHDGTVREADSWLKKHLGPYIHWAKQNDSVLILTWDEGATINQIPTIIVGAHVKSGNYGDRIDHYNLLRTIEDMYGLGRLGHSAQRSPITEIWD